MIFRVRVAGKADWHEFNADTPGQAASDWFDGHFRAQATSRFAHVTPDGRRQDVHFAQIEIDGHDTVIAREFTSGIYRRGGVKPNRERTIQDVARELGWEHAPADLLAPWDGEETGWRSAASVPYGSPGKGAK